MPTDQTFFLQQHALFYVPSLSVLREIRKREDGRRFGNSIAARTLNTEEAASSHQLLALGNPSLGEKLVSRAKTTMRDVPLTSLPGAEREVQALGDIYGRQRSKVLTGKAAQEEVVKAEAGNYPILHFATHGLLDNSNPLYSRLLLSNSTDAEDGFLEAREIMKLNLHAKLVVLSACQTALGRVGEGEGLIGMSWALFIAGASTTVTSQWKVDSTSTGRLMIDFHRLLQDKKNMSQATKAQTLRQASLKLMSDPRFKHPFYWAGFVVVGDGR